MNGKKSLLIIFLLLNLFSTAQVLDSAALANEMIYFTLEEALKFPDKVYRLSLKKQKFTEFPKEIFKFKNLHELDLSRNKIREIPPEIGLLTYLQMLNISHNKIEVLPKEIGGLKNLKRLIANQNELTALPVQIGDLGNLRLLDLWSNNITFFPDELSKLKNLKVLDLRVILLNDAQQERIKNLLPQTKIFFSPSCKC